jgi:hypothetical protein
MTRVEAHEQKSFYDMNDKSNGTSRLTVARVRWYSHVVFPATYFPAFVALPPPLAIP